MPYKNLSDLPDPIKNHLPNHAQEIYRAAFNSAWNEYKDSSSRSANSSREETAHKVAWAAVKAKYVKKGAEWKER
jgi:cation transport regulator